MRVEPTVLDEVISETSAIWPRWRSSGVATLLAMTSGLAPGSCACTEMVGKSTCGSGDTGSLKNAIAPASVMPRVKRVVATGRRMNGPEKFMGRRSWRGVLFALFAVVGEVTRQAAAEPREGKVDHRRGEQGQHLADDQATDDGDAERMAQLRSGAGAEHQRQGAEQRRRRRHQNRAQAQQASLVDGLARRLALLALGIEGEVDHHDGVLLDDADQENDADDGDDAEDDIDDDHRREDEQQLVAQRRLEGEGGALEIGDDAARQPERRLGLVDGGDRLAERDA